MDGLVKEVEGNIKPIRAEKMDETSEPASQAGTSGAESRTDETDKDIFLHVHRENVKCYRNTQAVVDEKTGALKQELEKRCSGIKGMLTGILILLLINLGATAYLIMHLVFGII